MSNKQEETGSLTSYDPSLVQNATLNPPNFVPFADIEKILIKLLSDQDGIDAIFASQKAAFENSTMEAKEKGNSSSLPIQTAGQPPQPTMKGGEGAQVCIKIDRRESFEAYTINFFHKILHESHL